MSQETSRTRRVGELIQQELGPLVQTELRDPRLAWVSILKVDVAPDLKSARVHYSCMPGTEADEDRDAVQESLERASGYIRGQIGRRLTLRSVPHLYFAYDDSLEQGDRMNRLLRSLHNGETDGE
ncbi:30S ribosome-binding factor RbfA [Thiohalorhabdus methylotrophus]|uniref:Ribosome-binding factor A n=1 Tax=Thiohalorhabdus methylotrophus TaxID=3242694 RepID=A0ABV4TW08_9GAMM